MKAYYAAHSETLKTRNREYAQRNKDILSAKRVEYAKAHADQQAVRGRRWYEANRAKAIEAATQWAGKNSVALTEYRKSYYKANRPKLRQKHRANYSANKDRYAGANKAWAKANPEASSAIKQRNKAKRKGAVGTFTTAEWTALKRRFQYRCVCCGNKHKKDDPGSTITADHVVPLARGGTNYISNIQPLCAHCNSSKSAHHAGDYRAQPFTGIAQLALIG